jgi:hypothetical protein
MSTEHDNRIREAGWCQPSTVPTVAVDCQFVIDSLCDLQDTHRNSSLGPYSGTLKKGTAWPMRLVKSLHILFLFLLSLGVFCSEVPESFNLCDDVSNDFVEESGAPHSQCTESASENAIPQPSVSPAALLMAILRVLPFAELSPFAGPDLLRLLTTQRK